MLYRLVITILLVAALPVNAATLKGVIRANEEGGEPMPNVPIVADGANPTTSESFGRFTLEFRNKNPGDPVEVIVKQEGYVPVNEVQLQLELPARPEGKILTIILCKEGDREEMARRFYRLKSNEAIEATYQQKLKVLEDEHRADAAALAKLQQERDQAIAGAEKASEQLAKNGPRQSSGLYQEAKRLFLDGKIDEAIKLLDDDELRQSLVQAKKAIEDVVQAWLLKAQLLIVQFRFEGAEEAYKAAIDAAPDNFAATFTYGLFNQELNRYQQAITAYSRCLELARKSESGTEVADTLNNMGILDSSQHRVQKARTEYVEALKTYHELAQKNREVYLPYVAMTLNNMGNLDRDQHRMEEARKKYVEALRTFSELAQKNPETYQPELAKALNNMGILDSSQHRMKEARTEYVEALQTFRELAAKNPKAYQYHLAQALNNLASFDGDQHRTEEARKEFVEALQIRRELAQKNPEAYQLGLAQTLNNMGILDRRQNRTEEAREEWSEALKIYESFAKKNPERFSADVTRVKNLLTKLPR